MKFLLLKFIRLYQRTVSPDHGWLRCRFPFGCCKFYPSCSQYAHEAIEKKGVVRGVLLAAWRVLRCNPWSKGGVDKP